VHLLAHELVDAAHSRRLRRDSAVLKLGNHALDSARHDTRCQLGLELLGILWRLTQLCPQLLLECPGSPKLARRCLAAFSCDPLFVFALHT